MNECGSGTIYAPDGKNFIQVSNLTLAPAQICKIKVTVQGSNRGGLGGSWNNVTDPIEAAETGLGATSNTAVLAVAPQFISQFSSGPEPDSLIDMGSSPAGTPVSKPLNIQNVGKAPLKVEVTTKGSGVFGGINSGDFTLSGANFNPFITLAPNEAKALTITCNPSLVGTGTASLTFKTDDLSQPLATYNLRCTGTFPGVIKPNDDGTGTIAGTLSFALAYVSTGTINFNLTSGNTVTLTSGNLPPLKAGVKLQGSCGSTGPGIIINGNGRPGGLVLGGNNQVSGLKITGFSGPQLTANTRNNKLSCIKVSK